VFIKTDRIIISDLERNEEENLFKIVWQKNVVRFMRELYDKVLLSFFVWLMIEMSRF
jgi:hypothetical protein